MDKMTGLLQRNELKAKREAYKDTINYLTMKIFEIDKSLELN